MEAERRRMAAKLIPQGKNRTPIHATSQSLVATLSSTPRTVAFCNKNAWPRTILQKPSFTCLKVAIPSACQVCPPNHKYIDGRKVIAHGDKNMFRRTKFP